LKAVIKAAIFFAALIACIFVLTSAQEQQGAPDRRDYHFLLSFENRVGGKIKLSDLTFGQPDEDNTYLIGHVIRPATDVREESFHATLWGRSSTVAASAVNAIHIKVFGLAHLDKGSTITIMPHELYGKGLEGEDTPFLNYSIYTDIPSGVYLFGGSFSPLAFSRVVCLRGDRAARLELGFTPKVNDVFLIDVIAPESPVRSLDFDNRKGGKVDAVFKNMTRQSVGTVERPVGGSGRFTGSALAPVGSIRATHAGVLDISTSPRGQIGGFQIIPWNHSFSKEMLKSRVVTQYLIVDSYGGGELTGVAPLFGDMLFPRVGDRVEPDLVSVSGKRVKVADIPHLPKVRIQGDYGKGLEPLRPAVGRDDNALMSLKRLLITFE
jgi:hypothetical protein